MGSFVPKSNPRSFETHAGNYPRADGAFLTAPADLELVRERAVSFVADAVDAAGADGVVVAMSGGIDSTVTAALAIEAVGSERVLGLGMPCNKADARHASDARTIAEGLGIDYRELHLRPLLEAFESVAGDVLEGETNGDDRRGDAPDHRTTGNATARLRMVCAYYAANASSRLVVGTANRSELLLGYFTKYGDGGTDCHPIGDLYKTEVRALAGRLGIPRRVVGKEPTAGFFAGQTDEADLGAPYEEIDRLLRRSIDRGDPPEAAAADLEMDRETARAILERCLETAHKRRVPPTPGIDRRSNGASPSSLESA